MSRKQWLENRLKGIGGSDAGAVLGLNPWMSNVDLWKIKTRRVTQKDISDKPPVKYGNDAEKPLRDLFALDFPQYKVIYKENNSYSHPKYPFLMVSLDGELLETATGRKGGLEVKTTEIRNKISLELWENRIPNSYYCQIMHAFAVRPDFEFFRLKAQLKRIDNEGEIYFITKHYHLERKDNLESIERAYKAGIHFWQEYVLKDIEPALILPHI